MFPGRIFTVMRRRVRFPTAGLAAYFLFMPWCGGFPAWGDIYTFQDEEGGIHFSNVPSDSRYRFHMREERTKPSNSLCAGEEKGYDTLIQKIAEEKGMDPRLVSAVVEVESNYDREAVSVKGASGLMQLMPSTAEEHGVNDVFQPEENLAAGICHLKSLIKKYQGSLALALAAYNAGEGAVDRYKGVPPYEETRQYVQKVLEVYEKRKEITLP